MSATTKKWINRAGFACAAIGGILVAIGGGSVETATTLVGGGAALVGAVLVLVREIAN